MYVRRTKPTAFGGDAHSWLNLQAIYDLRLAEIANARKIEREIMPIAV